MPAMPNPSIHDATRSVLHTTANAWRLKPPARNRIRARAALGLAGERLCPARLGSSLPGCGLAISY